MAQGSAPLNSFRFAVLTFGFSGSRWMATALSRPTQGMAAFHEPVMRLVGPSLRLESALYDSAAPLPRERALKLLEPYVDWMGHRSRQFAVLGEVHTDPLFFWREVPELLPERRLMLLRHGVPSVHSMSHSLWFDGEPWDRQASQRWLPSRFRDRPERERIFAGVCAAWAKLPEHRHALGVHRVAKLEELTSQRESLAGVHAWLTGRSIDEDWSTEIRSTVVNKKTRGDDSPANLFWNVWSESMRGVFRELCGEAMAAFGYEIPPRSSAPAPDLRPAEAQNCPPKRVEGLASVWAFAGNPIPGPVVVCGVPEYALAAANLIGRERALLLDDGEWTRRGRPEEFTCVEPRDFARLKGAGLYVADPNPSVEALTRLRNLMPGAEVVGMQPGTLTEAELAELAQQPAQGATKTQSEGLGNQVQALGPVRVKDLLGAWTVAAIHLQPEMALLTLTSEGRQERLLLEVRASSEHRTPFPVGEGGVYYRSTPMGFDLIAPAGRALAGRLRAQLGSRPFGEVLSRWMRGG